MNRYQRGRKWNLNIAKEYGCVRCVCHLAEAVEVQYLPLHMGEPDLGTLQLPEFSNLVQKVQSHPGESLNTHTHEIIVITMVINMITTRTHTRSSLLLWLLIWLPLLICDTYLQFIESLDSRCEAEIMNITGKRRLPILPEKNKHTHPLNQYIVKHEQIEPPIQSTPQFSQWCPLNRLLMQVQQQSDINDTCSLQNRACIENRW